MYKRQDLNDQLAKLWKISCKELVSGNINNFYAGQRICSRSRNESGEVFIRRRKRSINSGFTVPLQIEILESDYLDPTYDALLSNGNKVRSGIETNRRGQIVAYHFFKEHPSERNRFSGVSGNGFFSGFDGSRVRVLARDVIHHHIPVRSGQMRGKPIGVASLFKNASLEKYDDFELERKQIQASFTGSIEREARYAEDGRLLDPLTGQPYPEPDDDGTPRLVTNSGQFVHLGDGEKINLFPADKGGEFYADYMRQQLLAIAADHGIMYELVTGDWSKTTDRLYRAAMDDFKREIEAIQNVYMVAQVCEGVQRWWMDAVVFANLVNVDDYANNRNDYLSCEWIAQGWPYMHPLQDVQAAEKLIQNNLSTHAKEARKHSVDADEALTENTDFLARKKKLREENNLLETEDNEQDNEQNDE